ncbi:MAG TPA: helix-turn-helix domain-containing protein [Candidatus Acidoferrales bacterium]|nr:helix-turn-helix domain-containing protein [Candidatus Acidoferrales bacterium]
MRTNPGIGKRRRLTPRELRSIARVLSDPRRFDILKYIAGVQCAACSHLRERFPITPATLSHHLKELESCGLIETAKRGKFLDVVFQRPAWEAYLAELKKI